MAGNAESVNVSVLLSRLSEHHVCKVFREFLATNLNVLSTAFPIISYHVHSTNKKASNKQNEKRFGEHNNDCGVWRWKYSQRNLSNFINICHLKSLLLGWKRPLYDLQSDLLPEAGLSTNTRLTQKWFCLGETFMVSQIWRSDNFSEQLILLLPFPFPVNGNVILSDQPELPKLQFVVIALCYTHCQRREEFYSFISASHLQCLVSPPLILLPASQVSSLLSHHDIWHSVMLLKRVIVCWQQTCIWGWS